jgi:hypothetical protein
MKYLKPYNEGVEIHMIPSEISDLENKWGITIEDIEDVLLELGDLSAFRGNCKIKSPTKSMKVKYSENKRYIIRDIPQLIILASIKTTKEEYESIISTIMNRLSHMNLEIEDTTMKHSETQVDFGIYFVCLRLMLKSDVELLNKSKDKSNGIITWYS